MNNANIEKILAAQEIDKERLQLLQSLEKSKVKIELDRAEQSFKNSKENAVQLALKAEKLKENYQKCAQNVARIFAELEQAQKKQSEDIDFYEGCKSNLNLFTTQLQEISKSIESTVDDFKLAMRDRKQSNERREALTQKYEAEVSAVKPKIHELEQQFNEKVQGIDEKILAKYRAVRKNKGNDIKDVVVPLTGDNRCQGCFMDVPGAMVNKIKTDGWTICDECGRIIYQA